MIYETQKNVFNGLIIYLKSVVFIPYLNKTIGKLSNYKRNIMEYSQREQLKQ